MCIACEMARMQRAAEAEQQRLMYNPFRSLGLGFGDSEAKKPEPAKPVDGKPTPASIAEDIRRLAQSNLKADLSAIPGVVESEEAKRKDRILSDLRSVVNLAKLKDVKAKRFVLVCWRHDEAETYEGIDFAHGQYIDKDDESDEYRVFVVGETGELPTGQHYTLDTLKKKLDAAKIPHVISYRD